MLIWSNTACLLIRYSAFTLSTPYSRWRVSNLKSIGNKKPIRGCEFARLIRGNTVCMGGSVSMYVCECILCVLVCMCVNTYLCTVF